MEILDLSMKHTHTHTHTSYLEGLITFYIFTVLSPGQASSARSLQSPKAAEVSHTAIFKLLTARAEKRVDAEECLWGGPR